MKRMLRVLIILFLFVMAGSVLSSADESGRVVRVGYFSYDGFSMPDQDGTMKGYVNEYLDEIASYTGWNYEYVPGSVEECLDRLAKGEVDIVGGLQFTDKRAELYDRSQYEIGIEHTMLLVKEDKEDIYYDDYESFHNLKVGFIKGTYQIESMAQYAKDHSFSYTSYYYNSVEDLMEAIETGHVDAIVIGSLQRNDTLKIASKFGPVPFYFLTVKNNTEFLDELNNAMDTIQTLDVNYNLKLNNKYYGDSLSWRVILTKDEKEYIAAHPSLRVAYAKNWHPISYFNSATGSEDGISTGILEIISARSGIEFYFIGAGDEEEAIKKVQNGEADLIYGLPSQFSSAAKKSGIYLTKPYYDVPVILAALPGKEPKNIDTIAMPVNCNSIIWCAGESYPETEYIFLEDTGQCVRNVQNGMADAVFENAYILEQYYKGDKALVPEPLVFTKSFLPLSIGIGADAPPALKTLLNKIIAQISPEEINEIVIDKTMSAAPFDPGLFLRTLAIPMIAGVFVLILTITLRSKTKIERYAFTDSLTGYANKTKFIMSMEKLVLAKDAPAYAMVSLDIDKFKLINSMHGFDIGNRILKEIAELMRRDIGSGELFCREADDRFGMLMRIQSQQSLEARLQKLITNISRLPQNIGHSFLYTVSCGVYMFKKSDKDIYSALEWANLAREDAKEHRQNWLSWYDESMRQRIIEEQDIENRMEVALAKEEFQVYYQPKIQLKDDTLYGAEALVRWKLKSGELLCPARFIPIFESNGFILKLDLYVFEQVCRQMRGWIERGIEVCPISVNLSRVHLSEPDFYIKYTDILEKYNIPPDLIEIELTESMIFDNVLLMSGVISALKKAKLKVSVDDFGSGYSSLNLLKELPFDYLKLDKEFLNSAAVTERGKKVIRSTKYLADQLDMILLAEGVENKEQADFLRDMGCDLAQGYYFSKPLPLEEFEQYAGW